MKKICIKNGKSGKPLYEGSFTDIREALEKAVSDNATLAGADLRGHILDNASLDGADLRGANLDGCSFAGANLSETDMTDALARNVDFSLACMAESRLINVDFAGSSFTGAIITDAAIDNCIFNCPSALMLPLADARTGRNLYTTQDKVLTFTAPPVVITGLAKRIILLDTHVIIGDGVFKREAGLGRTLDDLQSLCRRA